MSCTHCGRVQTPGNVTAPCPVRGAVTGRPYETPWLLGCAWLASPWVNVEEEYLWP